MQMTRTTIRIEKNLKKEFERLALNEETTFQALLNKALREHLDKNAQKKAKKILFKFHRLGAPLDNLTRDDFYPDPKFK